MGFEDLGHAKLVRVSLGNVSYTIPENKREADEPRGFLLWNQGPQFRVLLGDLTEATITKKTRNRRSDDYVGWREVSLIEEATRLQRALNSKDNYARWLDGHDTYYDRISLGTQAFVLGRYAATVGRDDLAVRLIEASTNDLGNNGFTFERALKGNLTELMEWRALLDLANPALNRHVLAARFESIIEGKQSAHPGGDWSSDDEQLAQLRSMAGEDDAHPPRGPDELAKLTRGEQAAELVYELRDENTITSDYWPRPWPFVPTKGNGAVTKLITLGHDAVPALLTSLEDDRPTRSVVRIERWGGGVRVQTISELALGVLEKIAGFNFYALVPNSGIIDSNARGSQVRQIAQDWWRFVSTQREVEWLRLRAQAGAEGAEDCLDVLATRSPKDFVEVALKSAQGSPDRATRAEMIRRLAKVEAPAVRIILEDEMANGPTSANRVVAAMLLRERGEGDPVVNMIAELENPPPPSQIPSSGGSAGRTIVSGSSYHSFRSGFRSGDDGPMHVIAFLLESNSGAAVDSVRRRWKMFDSDDKLSVIDISRDALQGSGAREREEKPDRVALAAHEKLLISAAHDELRLKNFTYNGHRNPKVSEIAAYALARARPRKFTFNFDGTSEKRARQLRAIQAM